MAVTLAKDAGQVLAKWDRSADAGQPRGVAVSGPGRPRPARSTATRAGDSARPLDLAQPPTTPGGLLGSPERRRCTRGRRGKTGSTLYGRAWIRRGGEAMRLKSGAVDLPASEWPGRLGIFDVIGFWPTRSWHSRGGNLFGASYMARGELRRSAAAPKVLLSYGASSRPGSRHSTDRLPLIVRATSARRGAHARFGPSRISRRRDRFLMAHNIPTSGAVTAGYCRTPFHFCQEGSPEPEQAG